MEALQRLHNRGSISTGYDIDNSVKLEADNDEYLDRVITTQGNQKTFTISAWVKRTEVTSSVDGFGHTFFFGGAYGNEAVILRFNTGTTSNVDALQIGIGIGTTQNRSYTQRKFRDTSAWYHIVLAVDTTQATATDRFKLYVNGVLETEYASRTNPTQNLDTGNNKAQSATYLNNVGSYKSAGTVYGRFCGYIAEVYNIDGSALAPTAFGQFDPASGIWKPKEYTGSFPNNSFYLDFQDSSDLGAQAKGDDRNFTTYNITSADQATDTPTNNFCTWNPLWAFSKVAGIEEGGTKTNAAFNASTWRGAKGSIGVSKGKWYWEQKASGSDTIAGWQTENCIPPSGTNSHNVISTIALYEGGNYIWIKDSTSGRNDSSVTGTYAGGQVIGFALNLDSNPQTATFYRNGSAIATDVNIDGLANQTLFPLTSHYNQTSEANFGGYTSMSNAHTNTDDNGYGAFVYAPPSGYYALCTKNLEEFG